MQITVPVNQIFVVQASSGRFNGSAYIRAENRKQANELAQTCGWLVFGRVIKSETITLKKYLKDNIDEDDSLPDNEIEQINKLTQVGDYYEIEWGC